MSEHSIEKNDIDLVVTPTQESSAQNGRRGMQLPASVAVVVAALIFNALFLFALGGNGLPTGLAARAMAASVANVERADGAVVDGVEHDGSVVRLGLVITRPEGDVGAWTISETALSALVVLTSTESTAVDAGIVVSDCVEVKTSEQTPTIATDISKRDLVKCTDDSDGGSGQGDDETITFVEKIHSRPEEKVGTWVISDTAYTVTSETIIVGDMEVGQCVEVRSRVATSTVAFKIVAQDSSKCPGGDDDGGDDGGGDHGGEDQNIEITALVNNRPIERVGTWVISDTAYTVTKDTYVFGAIVEGDCVQLRTRTSTPTLAVKIIKVDEWKCGGGNNEERQSLEGVIVAYPPTLIGQWAITIGENKQVTFTTNADTQLNPDEASSYHLGQWVEVKLMRMNGGAFRAESVRADDHEVGEIVVRLASPAFSYTLASKYNLVLQSTLLNDANIYLYLTNDDHEQALASEIGQESGVIWAEVNYVNSVPEDNGYKTWGWGGKSEPDEYTDQGAFLQIRMGAESHAYTGQGVVVAVLDTGVCTTRHEQFTGKLQLPSLDVIDDDDDPSEVGPGLSWGHGTHVAGIISAIAPQAELLPVRVLDQNGRGNTFLLAYAIEWATKQPGVKVINLSLGTGFDSKILHDAIDNATEHGIIIVAAAGNDNTDLVQFPAGYHDVVSVTAVDNISKKAAFANYGGDWVDLAAPGVGIMSTMISEDGPGYASWSGTSMATAFVSGAAALVAEKWSSQLRAESLFSSQLTTTGLVVDALNPQYIGEIGRLLDVSAALGVDPPLVFVPELSK